MRQVDRRPTIASDIIHSSFQTGNTAVKQRYKSCIEELHIEYICTVLIADIIVHHPSGSYIYITKYYSY